MHDLDLSRGNGYARLETGVRGVRTYGRPAMLPDVREHTLLVGIHTCARAVLDLEEQVSIFVARNHVDSDSADRCLNRDLLAFDRVALRAQLSDRALDARLPFSTGARPPRLLPAPAPAPFSLGCSVAPALLFAPSITLVGK